VRNTGLHTTSSSDNAPAAVDEIATAYARRFANMSFLSLEVLMRGGLTNLPFLVPFQRHRDSGKVRIHMNREVDRGSKLETKVRRLRCWRILWRFC